MLRLLASGLVTLAASGAASAEVRFPYLGYVTAPQAEVRSGPGGDYYAASRLPIGYAVEIHRHDGERWCAIRPPQGSFSLAPTQSLRILDDRTAEIVRAAVPARVGSALQAEGDVVQVVLDIGEIVELVEPIRPSRPDAKIAPPAGEFRWIDAAAVGLAPPTEGESAPLTAGAKTGFDHLLQPPPSVPAAVPAVVPARFDQPGGTSWHSAAQPPEGEPSIFGVPTPSSPRLRIVPGSPADVRPASHDAPPLVGDAAAVAERTSTAPRVRFPGRSAAVSGAARGPLDPRVAEMHVRLGREVAHSPGGWQLSSLREEAAALLAQEPTPEVRDQLRDLVDRVAKFERIQQSHWDGFGAAKSPPRKGDAGADQLVDAGVGLTGQSQEILQRVRADLGAGRSQRLTQARYDAVGTLKPARSRDANAPRFALVDDGGEVVTLLSPGPRVDLQPLVGQKVGVNGARGFHAGLRRDHVVASRVTPLEAGGAVTR